MRRLLASLALLSLPLALLFAAALVRERQRREPLGDILRTKHDAKEILATLPNEPVARPPRRDDDFLPRLAHLAVGARKEGDDAGSIRVLAQFDLTNDGKRPMTYCPADRTVEFHTTKKQRAEDGRRLGREVDGKNVTRLRLGDDGWARMVTQPVPAKGVTSEWWLSAPIPADEANSLQVRYSSDGGRSGCTYSTVDEGWKLIDGR